MAKMHYIAINTVYVVFSLQKCHSFLRITSNITECITLFRLLMLVLKVPCTYDHAVICIIKVHSNDCNLCKHSQCNIKSVLKKLKISWRNTQTLERRLSVKMRRRQQKLCRVQQLSEYTFETPQNVIYTYVECIGGYITDIFDNGRIQTERRATNPISKHFLGLRRL